MYKQGYKEVALRVVYNKLTLLLLLGTSLFVNFYLLNQVTTISNNFEAFKNDPQAILQENNKSLISNVAELTQLPENEEPTIATVTDKSALENQLFFTNAQNGDKVLIYTNAQKAFLYRPTEHKLINVANVNLAEGIVAGTSTSQQEDAQPQNPTVNVTLLSSSEDLRDEALDLLTNSLPDITFNVVSNASPVNTYEKTLVTNVSGDFGQVANLIAQVLNGQVEPLPEGESYAPETNILVILGIN